MLNGESFHKMFAGFNSGNQKTDYIYFQERIDSLECAENAIVTLPNTLLDFIYKTVPATTILKEKVNDIKADQFEKMKEEHSKEIQAIREDSKKAQESFTASLNELKKKNKMIEQQQKEQLAKFEEERKKLIEKIEQDRASNQRALEEKQREFQKLISEANEENKKLLKEQQNKFEQDMKMRDQENKEKQEKLNKEIEDLKSSPSPPPKEDYTCQQRDNKGNFYILKIPPYGDFLVYI